MSDSKPRTYRWLNPETGVPVWILNAELRLQLDDMAKKCGECARILAEALRNDRGEGAFFSTQQDLRHVWRELPDIEVDRRRIELF